MMADGYFTDSGVYSSQPLPTPSDTPYRTPSFSRSRRTSGRGTPISASSNTPPPLLSPDDGVNSRDENGQEISPLDPRRFTPTLHASLVSEILNLRRELESKNGFIDKLEANFSTVKNENESLSEKLAKKEKESRAVKKQLQGLEDGTLSVIEELCKERDEAKKANAELKKRHEVALKKLKTQDTQAEQTQSLFERDKQKWDDERRLLERKVYVSEGRLRSLVEELQSQEATNEGLDAEDTKDSGLGNESETGSIRSLKTRTAGHARHRSSSLSHLRDSYLNAAGLTGVSLADELQSEGEGEEEDQSPKYEENIRNSVGRFQTTLHSRQSSKYIDDDVLSEFATVPGAQEQPHNAVDSMITVNRALTGLASGPLQEPVTPKPAYVDTGIQFTPPPSPLLPAQTESLPNDTNDLQEIVDTEPRQIADQSGDHAEFTGASQPTAGMAISRQSWGDSILPPSFSESVKDVLENDSSGSLNQTDPVMKGTELKSLDDALITPPHPSQPPPPPPPSRAAPLAPFILPSIAIHPPTPTPASPGEPFLPLRYRNASCQTELSVKTATRSIAMQTDIIRLDKRLSKLPPHLQPSAILTGPPSSPPERPTARSGKDLSPVLEDSLERSARKQSRQAAGREASPTPPPSAGLTYDDVFSENDADDIASEGMRYPRLGKPFKPYIRSTGTNVFDYDYFDELGELELSDNEYESYISTAKSARRISKHRMPPSVPEDQIVGFRSSNHRSRGSGGSRGSLDRSTVRSSKSYGYTQNKPADNRRALLTQKTGAVDHHLSRSPSFGSLASSSNMSKGSGPMPPFAIPIRRSSAGISSNKSEGSGSPIKGLGHSTREPRKMKRHTKEKQSIRKSFSTTSLRDEAESSRKMSRDFNITSVPGSAGVPPLPKLDLAMYQTSRDIQSSTSRYQQYTAITPTGNASVGTSLQHSVVDAIAASMVGEWIWKYVRKRASFGISESSQEFTKSGDARHKRWVWLSPYERTVMWSSKQPQSNAALMGKNGRKFVVQSVLDIKDDCPRPKGVSADEIFNRSILILTPSRALKFTAVNGERHYLWLTALSFLAHNTSTIPDLAFLPTPFPPTANSNTPAAPSDHSRSSANTSGRQSRAPSIKRSGGIRDSIRLAREKTTLTRPKSAQVSGTNQNQVSIAASGYNSPNPVVPFAPPVPRISDAALPPTIPRIYGSNGNTKNPILTMHNDPPPQKPLRLRKRSSTNPKARAAAQLQQHLDSQPPHGFSSNQSSRFSTANPTASNSTADLRSSSAVASGFVSGASGAVAASLPSPITTGTGVPAPPADCGAASSVVTAAPRRNLGEGAALRPRTSETAPNTANTAASVTGLVATKEPDAEDEPRSSDLSSAFGGNYNFFDAVAKSGVGTGTTVGLGVKGRGGAGGGLLGAAPMMQHSLIGAGGSGSAMAVAGGR